MESKLNKLAKKPKILDLTRHKPTAFKALAPAKINLFLHITGKRPEDGYHFIESLVVFADFGDEIVVKDHDSLHLDIKGPYGKVLWKEALLKNLATDAAKLLAQKSGVGGEKRHAHITLTKNLPIGAGVGGGSSDAATTAMLLSHLWNVPGLSDEELLSLGADVPACMQQSSLMMSGIGEVIRPVSIPGPLYVLLVNPGISLSAADVYKQSVFSFSAPEEPVMIPQDFDGFIEWLREHKNDLEEPAIALVPEIEQVLDALEHSSACLLARMSGSGTTCFGIYPEMDDAICAASQISRMYPEWWMQSVTIM